MNTDIPLVTTQDERLMAAFAHAAALLPFTGVVIPIVIWVTHKEKSHYAASQALQAAGFQLCMIVAWLIGTAIYTCSGLGMFLLIFLMPAAKTDQSGPLFVVLFLISFCIPFLVLGAMLFSRFVFGVYSIVATIITFQGKPFHYLFIGKRIERFIQPKQAEPVSAAPGD